jgi:class 3 adenylate cyclase/predicted ATPase
MQLAGWLEAHGLGKYAELFEAHEIDLALLPHLTEDDIERLQLPVGARRRLLVAIHGVRESGPADGPPVGEGATSLFPTAERRQLTVLFCDLVGSTALSHRLDPESLAELMRGYQRACAAVIEDYSGHVAQYLGDGLMIYFGWPRAHENDAERAVRASLEIIQAVKAVSAPEPLRVRIGIATGQVVVGETRAGEASAPKIAVGETPSLAARLQGLAGADEIVVAPATHRLLGGAFEYTDLGHHPLKGFVEPVQAWQVLRAGVSEGRFDAAHVDAGLTPLVGRDEELALLLRRWQGAKGGEGHVLLLSGEPGIGKSRIARALCERVKGDRHARIGYQCSPFNTQSALSPVIEQLERAAGFARDDDADRKLDKLLALLAEDVGQERLPAVAPLFAALLSLPAGRYAALSVSPQKQKEQTLEAVCELIVGLSKRQPQLIVLEDAHWIDPTTQEALDLLVSRIARLPVLLLVTYRPEFAPPWIGEPHVTTLSLDRLNRRRGAELAGQVTGGKALPPEVLEQIVAKADGVPLFVEELTKTVLESGLLRDRGDWYELTGPLPPFAIPSTLHDSLMARLDRLAPTKETVQIGACIGREFTHELIAAVSPLGEPELTAALDQLVQSELIFRQGIPPEAVYTFKHALIQDAAHGSLLKSRRRVLHSHIANVLVSACSWGRDVRHEFIAHHFTEAGLIPEAIDWWTAAGEQAGERSANAEAVAHYCKAIDLLPSLPESGARTALEVNLQVALGYAYIRQLGWAAGPVAKCLARAEELCHEIGNAPQLVPALAGMTVFYVVKGDQRVARAIANQTLELARNSGDTGYLIEAHNVMASALFYSGRLLEVLEQCDAVLGLYDPEQHEGHAFVYGQDPKVCALSWRAFSLAGLGFLDQALATATHALECARALNHGPSIMWAWNANTAVLAERGDVTTEGLVRSAITFCRERGIPFWEPVFSWNLALYFIRTAGRHTEGLAVIRAALSEHQATGSGNSLVIMFATLAEGCIAVGELEEASAAITAGLEHVSVSDDHWGEPELHRMSAELALAGPTPDESAAEAHFSRAIECGAQYDQRIAALRAAMGLARLWHRQGRRPDAMRLMSETYGTFSEGLGTFNLIAAKTLLDGLLTDPGPEAVW